MCGIIDDVGSFIKDSVGEIASHPGQALGAAVGVPGYDPFFGGLFNNGPNGALISPTGNFTSSAWNDMYNANPQDSGALGLFSGINSVADKVAPAAAGYFAAPALGAALGGTSGEAAGGLGGAAFTTGLGDSASTLGGLESGLGGAGLFGAGAGTGTAIGSGVAQGLGAGGLGIAGGDSLGGVVGSTFGSGLGSGLGTGLGTTGPASGAQQTLGAAVPTSGGATSAEGGQAATTGATSAPMPGTNGADAFASGAATNPGTSGLAPSGVDAGVGANASSGGVLGQGSASNGMFATDIPGQSIGADYGTAANSADQGGGWMHTLANLFGGQGGTNTQGIQGLMKLGNTGLNYFQQRNQQGANNAYANSIRDLFSPNSAYAQQMSQTLGRQDAAAGRNSQYGNRSVQLAAALAQAQANALGNSNYAHAATATPGANALNGLFANFASPQGIQQAQGLYNLGSSGFNSLSNLFG